MTLPPLPEPIVMVNRYGPRASTSDGDGGVFTSAQMTAYATAAVLAERARCIAIVEKWRDAYPSEDGTRDALDDLRSAV